MDAIFDWCVALLVYFAGVFGITYKEINVWVFVIIWPVFTLGLIALIFYQQIRIQRFRKRLEEEIRTGNDSHITIE
jgi:hypothetical protein